MGQKYMLRDELMPYEFEIIVPDSVQARLSTTCFRRTPTPLAGKFKHWIKFQDLMRDKWIRHVMAEHIAWLLGLKNLNPTERFQLFYPHAIGWSSTMKIRPEQDIHCQRFTLNRFASAMKVVDSTLPAPVTNMITFSCQIKKANHGCQVILRSLYPGPDIGRLKGETNEIVDITDREGVIFFDWNNPGDTNGRWPLETVTLEGFT